VHLDILSGRESVRGQVGGSDALSTQGGGATLTVAAGSLPQDTAIAISSEAVDSFCPQQVRLQFLRNTASISPAKFSILRRNSRSRQEPFNPATTFFLPRCSAVPASRTWWLSVLRNSMARIFVTQAVPGLQGIVQGGDYVFYKLTALTGFVSGTVFANSTP